MWERVFNGENRFWLALGRLGSLIVINLLTLACCLPVITAGAALTAQARLSERIACDREPSKLVAAYFKAFRENFRPATLAWLLLLAAAGVFYVDLTYARTAEGALALFFRAFGTAGEVCVLAVAVWLFALIARYENTLAGHLGNALKLALARLPQTAAMLVLWLMPAVACLSSYRLLCYVFPLTLIVGISGLGYLSALLRKRTFERFS